MTDLQYVKQFDPLIEEKFNRLKERRQELANNFLRGERRYWEDRENDATGQFAPEPVD